MTKGRKRSALVFRAVHQEKQRLILKALNSLADDQETPEESAAIAAMQADLERKLRMRVRSRRLTRRSAKNVG